ncbi:DUF4365 domain-containing protein [Roseibium sp. AS2]|uniref:DUF4365 domain-containing protein n=1 Tax=Roseibium sp. AS2 TaxID=3135781 RepID=UPI0031781ED7
MPITIEHTKENLCAAHIYAICASAGVLLGHAHVHDYGVDGSCNTVVHRGKRRVVSGFPLDFQAKSTVDWEINENHVVYDLESKTYNDIVSRSAAETTLMLVLLCLPKNSADWHSVTADFTTLRNCCFYHTFKGTPVDNEKSTKRVKIPIAQLLTPDSLIQLLEAEKSRREKQAA